MYIYVHIHIYGEYHGYIYHIYVNASKCKASDSYTYTRIYTYAHVYIHIHVWHISMNTRIHVYIHIHMYIYIYMCDIHQKARHPINSHTAHEWKNRTPNTTNSSIVHFLLLPGSQSSFTEITEIYCSLMWTVGELQYKIESYCTIGNYQLPHSVFVKHIYYTSSCSWSTTVRFLHSWAVHVYIHMHIYIYIYVTHL